MFVFVYLETASDPVIADFKQAIHTKPESHNPDTQKAKP
jgi:hypothetical protein